MQKPQKVFKFGPNTQNSLKSMYFYEILNFKHFLGPFFRIFKLTHAKPLWEGQKSKLFLRKALVCRRAEYLMIPKKLHDRLEKVDISCSELEEEGR